MRNDVRGWLYETVGAGKVRMKTMLKPIAMLAGVLAALAYAPRPADAATLRIGMAADPDTLDPAQSGSFISLQITGAICDKLVDTDAKLNYVPRLATSWQWSDDRRALTVKLRQGVTFQDGEPFDAAAVKWNFSRYQTSPLSKRITQLKPITGVTVVDPQTVRFELSAPYAPLLMLLADRPGMIMAPHATEEAGANVTDHPVCAGPYQFVRRIAQDRIILQRNPHYWDPSQQGFDEVQFVTMPDASLRLTSLRTGQLDLIERVAPNDIETVRGDAHLKLVTVPGLGYQLLQFNLNNGPMSDNPLGRDPRVREAFEDSIDREAINQVVFAGQHSANNQPEPIGGTYFDPDFPVPHRDVARAKALLKEAGYSHVTFALRVPNDPINSQVAEVIQSMAAEAGFDVKIQLMEDVALFAAADHGDFQANISIWSGRTDPDQNLSIWVASNGFLNNRGQYKNPQLDALLNEATSTIDTAQRVSLYRQAAAIYLKDRPYLFLYHFTWLWGASAKLAGFVPNPDGVIRVRGLHLAP
jgi:peptide/nickel transport system substrate-binding protein